MAQNRIATEPAVRLPRPADPPVSPTAFVVCPVSWLPGVSPDQQLLQQQLYQYALEQARAAARPSLPERDLLGVWN